MSPGDAAAVPLRPDALEALFAALDPGLADFVRDQREMRRGDLDRDDTVGIQARMQPVFEAFMACYTHERHRGISRSTDEVTLTTGFVCVIANLVDQVAVNIAEGLDVPRQDAVDTVMALIGVTLTSTARRHLGRYESPLPEGAA